MDLRPADDSVVRPLLVMDLPHRSTRTGFVFLLLYNVSFLLCMYILCFLYSIVNMFILLLYVYYVALVSAVTESACQLDAFYLGNFLPLHFS